MATSFHVNFSCISLASYKVKVFCEKILQMIFCFIFYVNNVEKSGLGFLVCLAFIDLKFSFVHPMKPRENILKSQESRTHDLCA